MSTTTVKEALRHITENRIRKESDRDFHDRNAAEEGWGVITRLDEGNVRCAVRLHGDPAPLGQMLPIRMAQHRLVGSGLRVGDPVCIKYNGKRGILGGYIPADGGARVAKRGDPRKHVPIGLAALIPSGGMFG